MQIAKQSKGKRKNVTKTPYGESIFEVNNSPETGRGVNNVIAFVKGTPDDFTITRTVRVNFDTEEAVELFRKDIYARSSNGTLEAYARRIGEEFLRYYDRSNYPNYRTYAESKRSQRSGSESEGIAPLDRNRDQRSGALAETQSNEIATTKVSSTDDTFF